MLELHRENILFRKLVSNIFFWLIFFKENNTEMVFKKVVLPEDVH